MMKIMKVFPLFVALSLITCQVNAGIIQHQLDAVFDGTELVIEYTGDYSLEKNTAIQFNFEAADNGYWKGIDGWFFVGLAVEGERDKRRGILSWSFLMNDVEVESGQTSSTAQYGHIGDMFRGYSGDFDQLLVEYEFTGSDLGETQTIISPDLQTFWYGESGLPFSANYAFVSLNDALEVAEPGYIFILGALVWFLLCSRQSYRQQSL